MDRTLVGGRKGKANVSRMRNSEVVGVCMLPERRGHKIGSLSGHGL